MQICEVKVDRCAPRLRYKELDQLETFVLEANDFANSSYNPTRDG